MSRMKRTSLEYWIVRWSLSSGSPKARPGGGRWQQRIMRTELPSRLEKRLDAGDGAAKDQRVDVVSPLIGVHGFQIRGVAHHVIFDLDAVAAVHVAAGAGDVQGFAAIVALDDGDHLRRRLALVHQPADAQRALQ